MNHGRYVMDREVIDQEEQRQRLAPYFESLGRRPSSNNKTITLFTKGVNWDLLRQDVIGMCDGALERYPELGSGGPGMLSHTANKIKDVMEQAYEKMDKRHNEEIALANDRHRFNTAMEVSDNNAAAMQGKWRRNAFPERKYERLKTDVVCAGLSELDGRIASYELLTSLKDSFLGLSYTYDDTGQSEGWMKCLLNETEEQNEKQKAASALASDDGVIKAQVDASMQSLLIAVQDRVTTEMVVLEQHELRSSNWEAAQKGRKSDGTDMAGSDME